MLEENKIKNLIIFGIITEIIYFCFYFIEPLKKYFNDDSLALSNSYLFFLTTNALLILLAIYIFSYKQIDNQNKNHFKIILIFFLLFNATLIFVKPISSIDVFSNIGRSRVLSEHHKNPYTTPYSNLNNDSFYKDINNIWTSHPTPYGPLFTTIGSAITFLGKNQNLFFNLFLFKIFFALINVGIFFTIHKTFKKNKITFLYAWNPLILYEFIINGHNDILTIFFLCLSLFFLLHKNKDMRNYLLSWTFLILSVLIKYMTIIIIPIFFLIILLILKTRREKIIFFVSSGVISASILFIFFFPFLEKTNIFSSLISYAIYPLKENKIAGLAIYPPVFTVLLSSFFKYSLSVIISRIIFIIFYLFIIFKIFAKRKILSAEDIIKYSCLASAVFLFTFFSWILPWYYIMLIVFLIYCSAIEKYKYNIFIYGLTFFSILYYFFLR